MQDFDAYRPPANQLPPTPGGPSGPDGAPVPWDAAQVLSEAWDIVKVHWPVLIFAPIIVGLLAGFPSVIINQLRPGGAAGVAVWVGSMVVQLVLGAFLEVGLARLLIVAARGGVPDFGAIFQGGAAFGRMFGVKVVLMILGWTIAGVTVGPAVALAVNEIGVEVLQRPELVLSRISDLTATPFLALLAGMVALVPLTVFLTLRLTFAHYYVADTDRGTVEALGASWTAMRGHVLNLFLFTLLVGLLAIAGMMACCVGLLPVIALSKVGEAIIYTRISGRMGAERPY